MTMTNTNRLSTYLQSRKEHFCSLYKYISFKLLLFFVNITLLLFDKPCGANVVKIHDFYVCSTNF